MKALPNLKEGDEAEIIIPYSKGYDRSNVINIPTGQILIPAYSTLIYRVKIHTVKSIKTNN